jgi:hypothetical protein
VKKPKVIQIAIQSGFDGPDNHGKPFVYVLYDNGEVWRAPAFDTYDGWEIVETPDDAAAEDPL